MGGKPMDVAHKHLGITDLQWNSFMAGADKVFADFKIAPGTQQELRAILASFRQQCTLNPGEVAPADPGNTPPSGSSLYAALGGVYPIAHFVDRLVEAVLKGDSMRAPLKMAQDPQGKRHAAGLKYMVTELVCHGTGGPEIVTSRGFDDAKLGIEEHDWPAFLSLAEEAADIWDNVSLTGALMTVLGELKEEICIGVFTTQSQNATPKLVSAGYSHFEGTMAPDKCKGDTEKALELLISGWTPPKTMPKATEVRCPFTGATASDSGSCPFGNHDDKASSVKADCATQGTSQTQHGFLAMMTNMFMGSCA